MKRFSQHLLFTNKGVALIEALIALAIFAVGMVGIAQFQGYVMQEGGAQKARDEATLLAQEKLDDFRNADKATFGALANGDEILIGNNASFTRDWSISRDGNSITATVTVSWTAADNSSQDVELTAFMLWNDVGVQAAAQGGSSYSPLPSTSGDATLNPGITALANPDTTISLTDTGVRVLIGEGVSQVVDEDNTVLLQTNNTAGFVRLRGYVRWDPAAGLETPLNAFYADPNTSDLVVKLITSDNSVCFPDSLTPIRTTDYFTPNEGDAPDGYFYDCVVSPSWYGNLAVVGYVARDELCPTLYSYTRNALFELRDPAELLWTLDNQNFVLTNLKGNDTCDSVPLPPARLLDPVIIELAGTLQIDAALTLGETEVEATTNQLCQIDATPLLSNGNAIYSYQCDVLTDADGWGGHVVVEPATGLFVCSGNAYYFPQASYPLTSSPENAVPAFILVDDKTKCAEAVQYEFTVVFQALADSANLNADAVNFTSHACSLISGDKKEAIYHCSVIAGLGETVSFNYTHPTAVLTPVSQSKTMPSNSQDSRELNANSVIQLSK